MAKMMNMKVANVIEDGRLCGPQVRIANVAKILKHSNIETLVFLPRDRNEKFVALLEGYGIPYLAGPIHKLARSYRDLVPYAFMFIYEVFWLWKHFRKEKVDLVHASGGAWQIKGVLAGKLAGVRTVWHLNDTAMPGAIRVLCALVARIAADGFIFAGERVREYYSSVGVNQKTALEIQAPVDTDRFDSTKVLPIQEVSQFSGVKILTVANINPLKGLEFLVEATGFLKREHLDFKVILVGDVFINQRAYFNSLKQRVGELQLDDSFVFYGPSSEVASLLASVDIYVCSSVSEASPTSVWEAMSMGKAIVSTDVGDVSRVIEDGESGYVVPPREPGIFAERVGDLINDLELRGRFGKKAREKAVNFLDTRIIAKRHELIYQKVLEQG